MNGSTWYVVQTKPKKEDYVLRQLQPLYETFFPKMRGASGIKALFPSYLFVRFAIDDFCHRRLVHYTRGVRKILGDGEGPVPVANAVVEALLENTRDGLLVEQSLLLKEGDPVRIKRGILRDLYGIVQKNLPEAGRVRVLMKWLSANMTALVSYAELEKAA